MHTPPMHQRRLWLIAGTGEGPLLATALLAAGWRLRVSVVTAAAARAYPAAVGLELAVGPIGADGDPGTAVQDMLAAARQAGEPFAWVVDASHPFASRISAALATACTAEGQPLLRLSRPQEPLGAAEALPNLEALPQRIRPGERLLLAIGARHLASAVAHSPGALHHCRLLPRPGALRQGLAAGLAAERIAPLHPSGEDAALEEALCRRWRIDTVLCRRAGGPPERLWRHICGSLGLRLLLLERPGEPESGEALPLPRLLERLGISPGAAPPAPAATRANGAPAG
jgi:precorrin-6A/cobalt-precorrin-6A reductase